LTASSSESVGLFIGYREKGSSERMQAAYPD